ncbi:MAG: DNA-binding protein [Ruminococcus sp.]|nr:DNA-binding protein [Ruminococcus sp.]
MREIFVTITGLSHYLGAKPFKVDRVVKLTKERDNEFDSDAIMVELPYVDTIGYVANSPYTVYEGTVSAGRLYDMIGDRALARVMFITHSSVIAKLLTEEEVRKLKNPEENFYKISDDLASSENTAL